MFSPSDVCEVWSCPPEVGDEQSSNPRTLRVRGLPCLRKQRGWEEVPRAPREKLLEMAAIRSAAEVMALWDPVSGTKWVQVSSQVKLRQWTLRSA